MSQWTSLEKALEFMDLRYGPMIQVKKNTYKMPEQEITDRSISDPSVEFKETWPRPKELAKSPPLHPDEIVEVRSMKDIATREVRSFRITRVISPFRFYAEYDINYGHNGYRHWQASFQSFYNTYKDDKTLKLSTKFVRKFRCYAHFNAELKEWERIRVFRQNHKLRLAEVYVCDYPSFKIVKFDSLRELKPEFSKWSAQGFRMHLIHVKPIGGGVLWSKKVVEYFKSLVQRRSFFTVVMMRTDTRMPDGFPDYIQDMGVFMVPGATGGGSRSLQAELVRAGFAEATGMSAGYPDMLEIGDSVPKFVLSNFYQADPSKLISCDTQPPVEVPTAEEATEMVNSVKAAVQALVDKAKPKVHEVIARLSRRPDISKPKYRYELDNLPKAVQLKLGYVRMCHLSNPGLIFVQMQSQIPKLREMELVIGTLSSKSAVVADDDNRVGIMVSTVYQTGKDHEPSWTRCIVTEVGVVGKDVIKVLVIDYGVGLTLRRDLCRYLPDYFKTIPSFAHRLHLDFGNIVPAGGKTWSADASGVFRKYIQSWDSQEPLYYIWSPPETEPVQLEDMHQIVQYNFAENKWEAGVTREFPQSRHSFKDLPILKHLYYSIGVEMVFEVVQKQSAYSFLYLTYVLEDGGYCFERKPAKGMPLKHKSIVKAMNNANIYQRQLAICKAPDTEVPVKQM